MEFSLILLALCLVRITQRITNWSCATSVGGRIQPICAQSMGKRSNPQVHWLNSTPPPPPVRPVDQSGVSRRLIWSRPHQLVPHPQLTVESGSLITSFTSHSSRRSLLLFYTFLLFKYF